MSRLPTLHPDGAALVEWTDQVLTCPACPSSRASASPGGRTLHSASHKAQPCCRMQCRSDLAALLGIFTSSHLCHWGS